MDPVPSFRFHPDPVGSRSLVAVADRCEVCGRARELIYAGPVYSEIADEPVICAWCIADGSAAAKYHAEFTDLDPSFADVPDEVRVEVLTRTPGFSGWQQERWMAHHGDAATFLGPVGSEELASLPEQATEALSQEALSVGRVSPDNLPDYMRHLSRDGTPTGYLFQCRQCAIYLGYSDYA